MLSFFLLLTRIGKKYLNYIIKFGIVGLAVWFIYHKVNNQKSLREFNLLMDAVDAITIQWTLLFVILLMFVNWMLEVVKWKYLSRRIEPIGYWKAIRSVFCGLTWAIFTPNRIGEYGGRVMVLKPKNRAIGAVAMGLGLFAQLVLTSFFGAFAIAWFIHTYVPISFWAIIGVWGVAMLYSVGFVLLYFNVRWVDDFVGKIRILKRVKPFFSVLEGFSSAELLRVLLLSLARFIIFTSQYVILMLVLLPELPFIPMVLMIFILFFVQSALPTMDIFDFSVRSFVASNLYRHITSQEIAVMAIVSFIWFVNLILPAIIGAFFVLNVNYLDDSNS